MIVWGGVSAGGFENTGGLYDPTTDTWQPTTTAGAPSPRYSCAAVWTGAKLIVWGGLDATSLANTGGIYDPATDSWQPITTFGAPIGRQESTAVWTGSNMVLWGGDDGTFIPGYGLVRSGGVYDPNREYVPLLWRSQPAGDLYEWLLSGTVASSASYLTPAAVADVNWRVRAIADFNGDRQPDLLWHNQVTGELYVWFMNGLVATSASYLTPRTDDRHALADLRGGRLRCRWQDRPALAQPGHRRALRLVPRRHDRPLGPYLTPASFADTRWQIRGVADFNGDGKPRPALAQPDAPASSTSGCSTGRSRRAARTSRLRPCRTRPGASPSSPTSTGTESRISCGDARRLATSTSGSSTT